MSDAPISLPGSASAFADAQVSTGRFSTVSEYLSALVKADEQTQAMVAKLNGDPKLAQLLLDGLDSEVGRAWSPFVLQNLKQQVLDRREK
jgi:Arc/MetJ-type ribon-helix-helix transcriptional regulator